MKNRIKPAQYEPYNLLSSSGNISIDSGVDYFSIDLSQQMSGDFNITGSLKINQFNVLSPDVSNTLPNSSFSNGCRIVAGSENNITGIDNVIVVGYNCIVSGEKNTVLFGDSINLGAQRSSALGNNISISHNGATVFSDSTANPKISYAPDSINIEYTGGAFIRSNSYFSNDIFSDANLTVTGAISGLSLTIDGTSKFLSSIIIEDSATITGSLFVTGSSKINGLTELQSTFITGVRAATHFDIQTYSGHVLSNFTTKTDFSNFTGDNKSLINILSGQITGKLSTSSFNTFTGSTLPLKVMMLTGYQNVSGIKSFKNTTEFCNGLKFPTQNNCDRYVPTGAISSGEIGHMVFSGKYLYVCTGTNLWGRTTLATW